MIVDSTVESNEASENQTEIQKELLKSKAEMEAKEAKFKKDKHNLKQRIIELEDQLGESNQQVVMFRKEAEKLQEYSSWQESLTQQLSNQQEAKKKDIGKLKEEVDSQKRKYMNLQILYQNLKKLNQEL
mmetsp:Transcript_18757/g.28815  ORF Transcript_18757/g.28815 Transcript_18757/m.28815 type:complete len:129 (-) Transcript_18757:2145-2531(-)